MKTSMRFWERNAIWFVTGFVAYLFFAAYDETGDKPSNAPYLLLWVLIRGVSLALSTRYLFSWAVRRFKGFAVWGPLACRWFAHLILLLCPACTVLAFTSLCAAWTFDETSTHLFIVLTAMGLLGAGVLAYMTWLIRADVAKVRKGTATTPI
jgi:hypothetical protein